MYIKPNEETANSIIEHATNEDHLQHKFGSLRNDFQLKEAIYGHMLQFPAKDEVLIPLSNSELVEYMCVVEIMDDIPEVYEKYNVRDRIIDFLKSIDFDNLQGSIAVISPFVGLYRSLILEVFLIEDGLRILHQFAASDEVLKIDSYIDEFESVENIPEATASVELIENDNITEIHDEIKDAANTSTKPGKLW